MPTPDKIVALPTTDPRREPKKQGRQALVRGFSAQCIDVDVCSFNCSYFSLLGSGGLLVVLGGTSRQRKRWLDIFSYDKTNLQILRQAMTDDLHYNNHGT